MEYPAALFPFHAALLPLHVPLDGMPVDADHPRYRRPWNTHLKQLLDVGLFASVPIAAASAKPLPPLRATAITPTANMDSLSPPSLLRKTMHNTSKG